MRAGTRRWLWRVKPKGRQKLVCASGQQWKSTTITNGGEKTEDLLTPASVKILMRNILPKPGVSHEFSCTTYIGGGVLSSFAVIIMDTCNYSIIVPLNTNCKVTIVGEKYSVIQGLRTCSFDSIRILIQVRRASVYLPDLTGKILCLYMGSREVAWSLPRS